MEEELTTWYPSKYITWNKNLQRDTRDHTDQRHEAARDHATDITLLPPQDPRIRVTIDTRDMKPHMNMQKNERLQGCENPCHQSIRVTIDTRDIKPHMNIKSERLQCCENPCHQKHGIDPLYWEIMGRGLRTFLENHEGVSSFSTWARTLF